MRITAARPFNFYRPSDFPRIAWLDNLARRVILVLQSPGVHVEQTKWQKRREIGWPVLLAATLTFCSGYPAAVPTFDLFEVDKLGHFAAYGALATAILRNPALARWPLLGLWWALPLASAYGLGDEFRQSLTHGVRQYDLADWAADTVGAVVAVTCYLRWPWYRRLLDMPIFRRRPNAAPEVTSDK